MFQQILVPLDGSTNAERALPWVEQYARRGGASVLLVTVKDFTASGRARRIPDLTRHSYQYLGKVRAQLRRKGIQTARLVVQGNPADGIVQAALQAGCDLIVMTRRGLSPAKRWLLGSVTEQVLRISPLPVLIAQSGGHATRRVQSILVPLDGSELSDSILPDAERLAAFHGSRLILCHVTQSPSILGSGEPYDRVIDTHVRIERWCRRATGRGVWASRHFPQGDPATEVLNFAEESSDMIALTTHGTGGLHKWLLGSIADKIIRYASVPVFVRTGLGRGRRPDRGSEAGSAVPREKTRATIH
jgi:nucleotide-binding universal stress UspA family protein